MPIELSAAQEIIILSAVGVLSFFAGWKFKPTLPAPKLELTGDQKAEAIQKLRIYLRHQLRELSCPHCRRMLGAAVLNIPVDDTSLENVDGKIAMEDEREKNKAAAIERWGGLVILK